MSGTRTGVGIAVKIASTCCMAVMFSIVKVVSDRLPVGEIVFIRSAISLLLILAIILLKRQGLKTLHTRNGRGHLMRSLFGATSMFFAFFAISTIPLASATAISFTNPILITLLAVLVLGERATAARWMAITCGFAGVLVIVGGQIRIGHDMQALAIGSGAAFASAALAALAMITLRQIAATESPESVAFYFMLVATCLGAATLPFGWVLLSTPDLLLLVAAGLAGGAGQILMSLSYRHAEASVLAPLDYFNLLWVTLIGTLVLGEIVGLPFYIGAVLIVAGGLVTMLIRPGAPN